MDTQRSIIQLVGSEEIEQYIDSTEFKSMLYKKSKTMDDYMAILTLYLFESLIPEVIE